jgi:hypothetical protein
MQPEAEFVAFVGIDWADPKRVGSLQSAHCTHQQFREREPAPAIGGKNRGSFYTVGCTSTHWLRSSYRAFTV